MLDIPLLFETGGEKNVDAVVVVSAPADVQRARVLSRPGMTAERLDALLARQMPDAEKRARAHFVVDSSRSFDSARAQVHGILRAVAALAGAANRIRQRACARSCSTPKPPASTPIRATGWSRSAASSWSTAFRPATASTATSIPSATCRRAPSRCTACRREFLKDKPLFADVCDEFLAFVGDAPLVAHNAMFDLGFINAELERCKKAALQRERLVDTLMLARRRYPAGPNRLDDLCARFSIDLSRRTKHGALLDAELLAEVYVELTGKRQARLGLVDASVTSRRRHDRSSRCACGPRRLRRASPTRNATAHRAFVATLGEKAIWKDYLPAGA